MMLNVSRSHVGNEYYQRFFNSGVEDDNVNVRSNSELQKLKEAGREE